MIVINASQDKVIAQEVSVANTFLKRLVGLLGRKGLPPQQGLIIKPSKMVHTFFMNFSLDLIFLDKQNRIVELVERIPPYRISPFVVKAEKVIELKAGIIESREVRIGDKLEINPPY